MDIDSLVVEAGPIESLSHFLLDLYLLAETSPLDDFRRRALDRLRELIPFDSGWWGSGMASGRYRFVSHAALHGLPDTFSDDYAEVMAVDHTSHELLRRRGTTLAFNGAITEDPFPVKLFDRKYGLHSCLSTHLVDLGSGVYQFLSTFRHERSGPFSEQERMLLDRVRPHLAQAWSINWRTRIKAEQTDGVAVTDPRGRIVEASPRFLELIHVRFPDWAGGTLPSAVARTARPAQRLARAGADGVPGAWMRSDQHFVTLHPGKPASPGLAPREFEVAVAYASGRSHKEIAQRLRLTPTTVRTYLQRSYERLGVSSKLALRAALEQQGADLS